MFTECLRCARSILGVRNAPAEEQMKVPKTKLTNLDLQAHCVLCGCLSHPASCNLNPWENGNALLPHIHTVPSRLRSPWKPN